MCMCHTSPSWGGRVSTVYERWLGLDDDTEFDPRKWILAFVAVGIGLLTFFLPLISTQPAILGKNRWSMYGIMDGVYAGDFFPSRSEIVLLPISLLISYALMLGSLVRLCFARPQALLRFVAGLNILLVVRSGYWEKSDFQRMFHSSAGSTAWPTVDLGPLTICLLAIMGSLLFITTSKSFGRTTSSEGRQTTGVHGT